jgi:hypothetical protein
LESVPKRQNNHTAKSFKKIVINIRSKAQTIKIDFILVIAHLKIKF